MLLNKIFRNPDLPSSHTGILRQFNVRFQPELRLTALTIHMNVFSRFLYLNMLRPLPCLDPVAEIFLLISSSDCQYVIHKWTGNRTCLLP